MKLSGRIQEINFTYRWNKPEHLYIAVIPDSIPLTPDTPQDAKTFCVIGKTSVSLHNQANPGQPVQDRRELVTSLQKGQSITVQRQFHDRSYITPNRHLRHCRPLD